MKSTLIHSAALACGILPGLLTAQTFDNSGNSLLQGNYFVRQVALDNVASSGAPARGRSLTGMFSFDGSGKFTVNGQVSDSTVSAGAAKAFTFSGTYGVSSSGVFQIQSPLSSGDFLNGGVGKSAFVGSATESNLFDVIIGVPVSGTVTNSSLQGQYRVGAIDIPNGSITLAHNATLLVNADGNGNLGTLSVIGQAADNLDKEVTQTVSGAKYSLSGSGTSSSNVLTFPLGSGSTAQSQLLSGSKQFGVSSDGTIFVGGNVNGYDLEIGVKTTPGANNSTFNGTYYTAGSDIDNSGASQGSYYFDAFYGSITATGTGTIIGHERINPTTDYSYDYTFDDQFTVGSDGGVSETFAKFYVGAGGQAAVYVGRSAVYSIGLSVSAVTLPASGSVYLNPIGVVNAASYAPITNPITPGEMIRLYGSGLAAATLTAQRLPFPTNLGGVSVSINGRPAPLYLVSPGQIVCIVPYATETASYGKIIVTNNGIASNAVTAFTETAAPGVFTVGANGVGDGATLHANGALVTSANPAKYGETVTVYVTGLGAVTPAVADGTGAPSKPPLAMAVNQIGIFVEGVQATVTYAGLAPGFVGLYQINFVVPTTSDQGEVFLDISDNTSGAYASQATIPVSK